MAWVAERPRSAKTLSASSLSPGSTRARIMADFVMKNLRIQRLVYHKRDTTGGSRAGRPNG